MHAIWHDMIAKVTKMDMSFDMSEAVQGADCRVVEELNHGTCFEMVLTYEENE